MPDLCLEDFEAKTFTDTVSTRMIQWHDGICLVNHWMGTRQQGQIAAIFERRLPAETKAREEVMFKQEQTVAFWRACSEFRAQREDIPMQVLKTDGPYPEAVDFSVSTLGPGQSKPFRLTFEGISAQWNRQYPEIQISDVAVR